jgi:ADP-ribosyl-[dinitrogen reductase] hydrolase
MDPTTMLKRYHGGLLGLACGDALGTTLEFRDRGTFTPIADMIGGGPFGLEAGEWTDDTSMAMCLAESLVERGFDPLDQMQRYVRWWQGGYWSSNGRCFDIGGTVAAALRRFEATSDPMVGITDTDNAPNGSLMRLAPVPLRYASTPSEAVRLAATSSKTTHGAREAVDACRYFAALLIGALQGRDKRELLSPGFAPEGVDWPAEPLAPAIAAIAAGSFKTKSERQIRATGYVVDTLEAALWALFRSGDFREGALLAANLGEDADTTGAVYGQLAGAYCGVDAIPGKWRDTGSSDATRSSASPRGCSSWLGRAQRDERRGRARSAVWCRGRSRPGLATKRWVSFALADIVRRPGARSICAQRSGRHGTARPSTLQILRSRRRHRTARRLESA